MAEYIVARRTRNAASSAVHILLNLLLGIGSVMITVISGSPIFGLILVLCSKWRVFAVRPHFIWPNIKSNLVDFIVGVSIILLTYFTGTDIMLFDILLAIFYCLWLIIIKPQTTETANLVQSLIAIFLGVSALSIFSATISDSFIPVALAFIIGYSTSRHVLLQNDDKDSGLSAMVCGLIFAEIFWLCYSWMIIYTFGNTGIRIPQPAILLTIIAFAYNTIRKAVIKYDEDFSFKNIWAPIIFCITITTIIVLFFSNPIFNI